MTQGVTYALLAGVVALTIAGALLLGAYFSGRSRPDAPFPAQSALDAVAVDGVAPDLAVLTLAGENDERIARAARDAGELETAYATLAYSTLLPDNPRNGLWLLLADDFAAQDPNRALVAARAALDMAALAPDLGDLARADVSLQAAKTFQDLGAEEPARLALAQAEEIGRHGLSLLPAQRRAILARVSDALRERGDTEAASALRGQLAEAVVGSGVQTPATVFRLSDLRGSIVLPADVAQIISRRQEAAASLAARWLPAGAEERIALAAALGEALLAEDEVRTSAYSRLGELSDADRLALLHDQIAWQTVKYRVARRGYGVSLVPAWEAQVDAITQQLASTYTELINGYGRQLDALDATSYDVGHMDLLRQGLLWSRLGLFPGDAGLELGRQLVEASTTMRQRLGNAGLGVATSDDAGLLFYILRGGAPSEQAATQDGG
jgi:hypothetical protein